VFAKRLVELGRAYPCFCSEKDLESIRERQEKLKQKTGYYGNYALCKNLKKEDVVNRVQNGDKWVLRADFGSYKENDRITWNDLVKGDMSLPAEINDPVILKSNGIPPYNLAHIVDDTLMRISHVLRGEEWLVSTAQHIQLFELCDIKNRPQYAHMPVICIEENGKKRKLSKRKDKEAIVQNFIDQGYPVLTLIEYLLTLYNTDFELWRIKNPTLHYTQFEFKTKKIGSNNPLFDWDKLNDISKNIISKMTCEEINKEVEKYFQNRLKVELATENVEKSGRGQRLCPNASATPSEGLTLGVKSCNVLDNFEKIKVMLSLDRETPKPRKDIVKYSDIPELYNYILEGVNFKRPKLTSEQQNVLKDYVNIYNNTDDRQQWFARIKERCEILEISPKDYTGAIRLAIAGRENTPCLYTIMQLLGVEETKRRLKA